MTSIQHTWTRTSNIGNLWPLQPYQIHKTTTTRLTLALFAATAEFVVDALPETRQMIAKNAGIR